MIITNSVDKVIHREAHKYNIATIHGCVDVTYLHSSRMHMVPYYITISTSSILARSKNSLMK